MAQSPVCPAGSHWCTLVRAVTHSDGLARAADWLIARPLAIIALIIIGYLLRWVIHRLIDRLVRRASSGPLPPMLNQVPALLGETSPQAVERRRQRAETMGSLLKSIATAVIATVVIFMIVAQLGYDIAPLIASAGIVGIALAFGAQSLVKDFLSGIFLIVEDQYGVGDSVMVGTTTGTVEAVTLRVTRLRAADGTVWYVRNGEILSVGNLSRKPTTDPA